MIKALKIARKRLASGDYAHICFALPNTHEGWRVRGLIERRLGDYMSLGGWLIANGHATQQEVNDSPHRMRITRLAWIDSLIEELS